LSSGTVVNLTATPAAGSTFGGWGGACSGTGGCVITLSQDRAVTATFNAIATGGISGRITDASNGSGIPGANAVLYAGSTIGAMVATVDADATGAYVFSQVPAGVYAIVASASGYGVGEL